MKWIYAVSGFYLQVTGIAILGSWILILRSGPASEGLVELGFHLASEALLAFACIFAGWILRKRICMGIPAGLAAYSMLIYSVLNALGYYAQLSNIPVSILFTALLLGALILTVLHIIDWKRKVTN